MRIAVEYYRILKNSYNPSTLNSTNFEFHHI
jgi:hypothetical protein